MVDELRLLLKYRCWFNDLYKEFWRKNNRKTHTAANSCNMYESVSTTNEKMKDTMEGYVQQNVRKRALHCNLSMVTYAKVGNKESTLQ